MDGFSGNIVLRVRVRVAGAIPVPLPKYNIKAHFAKMHPLADFTQYSFPFNILNAKIKAMQLVWKKQKVKQRKPKKLTMSLSQSLKRIVLLDYFRKLYFKIQAFTDD